MPNSVKHLFFSRPTLFFTFLLIFFRKLIQILLDNIYVTNKKFNMFIPLTNNKNIKSKIKNYTIDTSKYYIINKDNTITYVDKL